MVERSTKTGDEPQSFVKVRLHGAALLFSKIDDAGHTEDLKSALGEGVPTLTMDRNTFDGLKSFVDNSEKLKADKDLKKLFACDPNDPDDLCL